MARILIAGCGDVGTALGRNLAAAGHTVWGLKRHPDGLPPGIQPLAADLSDPATLRQLPPELDGVAYCTAATDFSEAAYQAAYVTGVDLLLDALAQSGQPPRRFVFKQMSSRWGSLAPDGTVALDLSLVLAPPAALQYVLVHELCHLIQPNHSAAFWAEVSARMPAWPDQRQWLAAEGRRLKYRLRSLLAVA